MYQILLPQQCCCIADKIFNGIKHKHLLFLYVESAEDLAALLVSGHANAQAAIMCLPGSQGLTFYCPKRAM